MSRQRSILCVALLAAFTIVGRATAADNLVIAANEKCDYRIVVPDKAESDIVDQWLWTTAKLMEAAFERNGFEIDVVRESGQAGDKPAIYIGATAFAKKNGVSVDRFDDWTYRTKTIGNDLVIIGNDKKDPVFCIRRTSIPQAMLGTVKGVCDFLREHAGVRFLMFSQRTFAGNGPFDEDGALDVDTRSIAFTPVTTIAVPKDIDHTKTPMMRANHDFAYATFYNIANNFFPKTSFVVDASVNWRDVVPVAKYGKTHPHYYALNAQGGRSCDTHPLPIVFSDFAFCPANNGVQDLMVEAIEERIEKGAKRISMGTQDSFGLCRCNCEDCNRLFGMKAETMAQVRARAKSGKLWQAFFNITERFREGHPEVKFVILNYQDTPISADIIKRFPDNVIPEIQFGSQLDFDRFRGVEFPSGVCGFEETFTGFGRAGRYVPERTSAHMAEFVKTCERNKVQWSRRDGVMGNNPGMEGQAYYVYGRMMDNPSADWRSIQREFCDAAFGPASAQMMRFYDLLDMHIALYSDFLNTMMPAWRGSGQTRAYDSKWHVTAMFSPEYIVGEEKLLAAAERNTQDADRKARLHLVRIEFDYIRKMAMIFHKENAYIMDPADANLDLLLDAIDKWHGYLANLTSDGKRGGFKPLDDWPEMRPFHGHNYSHAALEGNAYQQTWTTTCLNWDTQAIRNGALEPERRLEVRNVDTPPGIDSTVWDNAPGQTLIKVDSKPFVNLTTTMKILSDKDALYVLVKGLAPRMHPEDILKKHPDGDIFKDEYVELGISPPNADGTVYRIAVNPAEGCRFDSIVTPEQARTREDTSWNGTWEYATQTTGKKGRWTLPGRVWTVWFRMPFADFGRQVPEPGETWGFNVGRDRRSPYLIWQNGKSAATPDALGKLVHTGNRL